eukprot:2585046-Prymnesium_polylepis.1
MPIPSSTPPRSCASCRARWKPSSSSRGSATPGAAISACNPGWATGGKWPPGARLTRGRCTGSSSRSGRRRPSAFPCCGWTCTISTRRSPPWFSVCGRTWGVTVLVRVRTNLRRDWLPRGHRTPRR